MFPNNRILNHTLHKGLFLSHKKMASRSKRSLGIIIFKSITRVLAKTTTFFLVNMGAAPSQRRSLEEGGLFYPHTKKCLFL